jgi:hypothetical protein
MSLVYSAGGVMPLPLYAWDFNGTTTDYVSGLVPTSIGGSPTYVAGKYNQGLNFPNSISTGTSNPTNNVIYTVSLNATTGFTFAFWVNFNYGSVFAQVILAIGASNGGRLINVYLDASNQLTCYDGSAPLNFPSFSFSIGTWYHVSLVVVNGTRTVYINGQSSTTTTTLTGTSPNRFILGGDLPSIANYSAWCSYDDLRIYNTALTAAQVQAIYNQRGMPGRGVLSLISPIVFMQNFGTSSVPTSDLYGATLTSFGSPTMYLDATRGYVFPGTGSTYMSSNFNLPVSYSKSIWVYLTGAPGVGNLISSASSAVIGIHFMEFNSTYSIRAGHYLGTTITGSPPFFFDIGTDFCTYVTDPGTITLNQWTHYVLTYDQSTTTMKLFRDGVQVASTTNAEMSWSGGNAVGLCHYSGSKRLSNGRVDNPIIYNRALNESEIYTLYTSQLNNPTLGETTYNPIRLTGTPLFAQLSTSATSSAVGAFSLRAVNGVTARAIQVRNGTTSATQDFYADRLGNLLTAPVVGQSLASWLGGATGYVTTWYDQSGRGNHATQATAANQPIITRATKGPGYACVFNGTTNYLTGMSYTVLNATNFSFNIVERRTGSSSGGTASNDLTLLSCGDFGATGKLLYLIYRNNTNSLFGSWSPELYSTVTAYSSSTEPIRYTSATASSTSGRRVYIYNDPLGNPISASDATQTSLMSMTSGNFQIGYYTFGSSTSYYKGEIYELIVFTKSLYDLYNTGGLITQIYQNQLGIYGT